MEFLFWINPIRKKPPTPQQQQGGKRKRRKKKPKQNQRGFIDIYRGAC